MYPAPLGVRELKMPLLPKKDITDMADRQKNHVRITIAIPLAWQTICLGCTVGQLTPQPNGVLMLPTSGSRLT